MTFLAIPQNDILHHIILAIWKSEDPNETANTSVDSIRQSTFTGDYLQHELTVDLSAGDYIRLELGINNNATGTSSVLYDSLEFVND